MPLSASRPRARARAATHLARCRPPFRLCLCDTVFGEERADGCAWQLARHSSRCHRHDRIHLLRIPLQCVARHGHARGHLAYRRLRASYELYGHQPSPLVIFIKPATALPLGPPVPVRPHPPPCTPSRPAAEGARTFLRRTVPYHSCQLRASNRTQQAIRASSVHTSVFG